MTASEMQKRRPISTTATSRLKQDYARIIKDPVPFVQAAPLPSNILEWHYIVLGPENTPYEGGIYHGKLVFPNDFPFKPPSIYMITPNGRFRCNTRKCNWNKVEQEKEIWELETSPTLGSIETTDCTRRQLAASSGAFNLRDKVFCDLFGEVAEDIRHEVQQRALELDAATSSSGGQSSAKGTGGVPKVPQDFGVGGTTLANIAFLVGFAMFAYTVRCVLWNA